MPINDPLTRGCAGSERKSCASEFTKVTRSVMIMVIASSERDIPSDRGTDADVVLFSRLTSGRSSLHELDDSDSQLTRIRCAHRPALRRINALDSLILTP
jgi:hypothetical protein